MSFIFNCIYDCAKSKEKSTKMQYLHCTRLNFFNFYFKFFVSILAQKEVQKCPYLELKKIKIIL